ncbi:MAG TPA: GNAT family N-acetyltransferase [Micromonosporaceae bacterium]|jgi:predicted acetyltransferase
MTADELPIRAGRPDDWDGVGALLSEVFHDTPDPEVQDMDREVFEPERALIVEDDGRVVAHAGAFTRDLTVPGAVVPAAHVTMVGVAPTHRRRRLLTRLMHRQLREVGEADREPIAVLWASEGRIYPRFGYGLASQLLKLSIDTREVRMTGPPAPAGGRLRTGAPAALQVELAKVYDQLRPDRPGWSSRDDRWWRYVLVDPPSRRHGGTERRAVVHEGQSGVDGYALWRTKSAWDDAGPKGEVMVQTVVAGTHEAYRALWGFLLGVDLTRTVSHWAAALDEPLQYLVNEPRRLNPRLSDSLWVRVIDVPAALAARRYAVGVDAVFEVTDPLLPENQGRWRVVGDPSGARCTPTDAEPDLACDVVDLGAAYLGGTSLAALAGAGRVRELRPDRLGQVDAAFGWHRAPAAHEVF